MLAYHPAFDIYHCSYRVLCILEFIPAQTIEIDRLRIWDFYFTFPNETHRISFPQNLWNLRSLTSTTANPYEEVSDPLMVFERMRPFQLTAFKYLSGHGFFERPEKDGEKLTRTEMPLPEDLVPEIDTFSRSQQYVLRLISSPLNDLSLYGPSGLKARTKLIDYRYDPT